MMNGFGMMGTFGGWWMILGMVAGLLILALLLWGLFSVAGTAQQGRTEDTALEVLKKRYAAGEISQAEFEVAKRSLA